MPNPNEYNDEDYSRWSVELDSNIGALWDAGAELDEIAEVVRNGFENAGVSVYVTVTET